MTSGGSYYVCSVLMEMFNFKVVSAVPLKPVSLPVPTPLLIFRSLTQASERKK
jgi:hypothetical protein